MQLRTKCTVIIAAAAITIGAVACGGGDDGGGTTATAPAATATRGSATASAAVSATAAASSTPAPADTPVPPTVPAAEPTQPPAPPPTTAPPPPPPPAAVALAIVARGQKFVPTALTAAVGSSVTITLDNQDDGVIHDIQFFNPGGANVGGTELLTGPVMSSTTFGVGAAGTYRYKCSVHPQDMLGILTVS